MGDTTRRGFMGGMAAIGAAAAVADVANAASDTPTRQGGGLVRPEGRVFDGMTGAYSAMYTPFFREGHRAGELNEEMIERLVEYAVGKGLTGMYLTGSTGEGFLLSKEERVRVWERAAKSAKGRLKLIAHVGCLNTDDACDLARAAARVGMDWVSSVAPV